MKRFSPIVATAATLLVLSGPAYADAFFFSTGNVTVSDGTTLHGAYFKTK